MSLVIGFGSKNEGLIVSDGRAGNISEHFDKTRKINDRIIIGFVGFLEEVEMVLNPLLEELRDEIVSYSLDDFLELLYGAFQTKPTNIIYRSSFLLIGIDNNGCMATAQIGYVTNFEIEKNVCETPRICSIGGTIDESIISSIINKNIIDRKYTILGRMKKSIGEVSKLDPSVNAITFYQYIHID